MEEILGLATKVSYSGAFSRKDLVTVLRDSIEGFGYSITEKDVSEDKSKLKFTWSCSKNYDDYTKASIDIKFEAKKKGEEGEVSIEFKSKLYTDYKNKWEKGPFYKILKEIYDSTFYKPTLDRFKKKLAEEVTSVVDDVKSFLNMYRLK